MQRFAALYAELDAGTSAAAKVQALARYFAAAPPEDAAWALYFLAGGRPRQTVPAALLRATACREAAIDDWLFEACHQAVGDLAETIAHVLPVARRPGDLGLAQWVHDRLWPLHGQPPGVVSPQLAQWWSELDWAGRFLLTRLIGAGFRLGVSKLLVQRALAQHAGLDAKQVAERMVGYTDARSMPSAAAYLALLSRGAEPGAPARDPGQPYPFFPAQPLDLPAGDLPARLGPVADWMVEWQYDGLRAQVVRRAGRVWVWSCGDELVTEHFPEVAELARSLPDGTVLEGELLAWQGGRPAPLAQLQRRIGRKAPTRRLLAEVPVAFIACDLLERAGTDLRALPQQQRRAALEALLEGSSLRPAPQLAAAPGLDWHELAALRAGSRSRGMAGLMLKHRLAAYGTGHAQAGGTWWQWQAEPMSVDGVLIYAQAGHGRRDGLFTDYTLAVWSRAPAGAAEARAVVEAIERREPAVPGALQLVPFAKAGPALAAERTAGLTDAEFREVDHVIRATTLETFGPVCSVRPTLVFELGFEGIHRSARHKSGLALRSPRLLRLRAGKPLHQADTLARLQALLNAAAPPQ
jgi:DNA ligase-1